MADEKSEIVRIASNKDVLDSISIIVKEKVMSMYPNIYFIVSIPNDKGATDKLEKLPFDQKLRIVKAYVFTDPLEVTASIYFRVRTTTTPKTIYHRLANLGFEDFNIRVRITGVRKLQLMRALMGGFNFGKYPFPFRPYFREVTNEEKEFFELRGKSFTERRQKDLVEDIRSKLGRKTRGSDDE